MDLWTFQRFQQPRLSVDTVDHDAGQGVIRLQSGQQTYRLALDDDHAAARLAEDLRTLADSTAPLWSELRSSTPESPWFHLATFLDTHSLVAEGRDGAVDVLATQALRVRQYAERTTQAILEGVSPERRARMAKEASALRGRLDRPTAHRPLFEPDGDPLDADVQPNFFLGLLHVEFEYFRRSSPLTLAAVDLLFAAIADEHDDDASVAVRSPLTEVAGVFDERDLASHLWVVGNALAESTGSDALRYPTAPIPSLPALSGLEFMRQTELVTRDTLMGWGESPFVTAIDLLDGAYAPLVAGPFIEQYHVTYRFVEIIAPLLRMRTSPGLRSQLFQYFSEEYGHEALESTTVEALGVAESTMKKLLPLPLHYAFVDALTLLADLDPISSFASVMVIEGVFGEPPRMSLRLAAAARDNAAFRAIFGDHDQLNESLNHNSLSRDLFAHVAAVSPARIALAIRRILILLELNHRAWRGITDFYGPQSQLQVQGPYGRKIGPKD